MKQIEIPWWAIAAGASVAAVAWLRGQMDWPGLIGFVACTFTFYFAGRNAELADSLVQVKEAQRLANESHRLQDETRQLLRQAIDEARHLAMAYRQLHDRHFKMTGELVPFLDDSSGPKTHDA